MFSGRCCGIKEVAGQKQTLNQGFLKQFTKVNMIVSLIPISNRRFKFNSEVKKTGWHVGLQVSVLCSKSYILVLMMKCPVHSCLSGYRHSRNSNIYIIFPFCNFERKPRGTLIHSQGEINFLKFTFKGDYKVCGDSEQTPTPMILGHDT